MSKHTPKITIGIDMASQPKGTAACHITWPGNGARPQVTLVRDTCNDECLRKLISQNPASVVGIDAPFGWPAAFHAALNGEIKNSWDDATRKSLQFRYTDDFVRSVLKSVPITGRRPQPLSVSSDRIALPAMRTMSLLKSLNGAGNNVMEGPFIEVYPAASLALWGLTCSGYKDAGKKGQDRLDAKAIRRKILNRIRGKLELPDKLDEFAESDHALDAFVAALTARAAALGKTLPVEESSRDLAIHEGWIHLPDEEIRADMKLLLK